MSRTKQIIIPNEIPPRKPITRAEIARVLEKHKQLRLLMRSTLELAWEIGPMLQDWRDRIPHGQWLRLLREKLPEISARSAQVYLQLQAHKEAIQEHFKSAEFCAFGEPPSIKAALDFIASQTTAVEVEVEFEERAVSAVSYISPEVLTVENFHKVIPSLSSSPIEQLTQEEEEEDAPELPDTTETAPEAAIQSTACSSNSEAHDDSEWFALSREQLTRFCPDCRKLLEAIRES